MNLTEHEDWGIRVRSVQALAAQKEINLHPEFQQNITHTLMKCCFDTEW